MTDERCSIRMRDDSLDKTPAVNNQTYGIELSYAKIAVLLRDTNYLTQGQ